MNWLDKKGQRRMQPRGADVKLRVGFGLTAACVSLALALGGCTAPPPSLAILDTEQTSDDELPPTEGTDPVELGIDLSSSRFLGEDSISTRYFVALDNDEPGGDAATCLYVFAEEDWGSACAVHLPVKVTIPGLLEATLAPAGGLGNVGDEQVGDYVSVSILD